MIIFQNPIVFLMVTQLLLIIVASAWSKGSWLNLSIKVGFWLLSCWNMILLIKLTKII